MANDNGRIDTTPQANAKREDREVGIDEASGAVAVKPSDGDWVVTDATGDALGSFSTKSEAVSLARKSASEAGEAVTVRRSNGTFQETFTPRA